MNNLGKLIVNILTAVLFIVLLVVNVQVGSGSSYFGMEEVQVFKNAKAGNCDPGSDICSTYEFPDGKRYHEIGEIWVVTPGDE